ncbi:hypothetical protein E2N92_10715 [Methanofollis formosanus]|uniref:Alpha-L-glutamate ligase-related protein ATP-grasp domain-containing protein n=1 Tax=Methanofollis formosanus TaxID=299308 RepID=A0A8G1EGJ1_9EURY|nr:sugar-transfer associated ATP-grasp domain-containing protein [Methanofollis formosanus]QYZ79860.1 hypothetical protein E2N92_10715 [Methanofollis formosanus]
MKQMISDNTREYIFNSFNRIKLWANNQIYKHKIREISRQNPGCSAITDKNYLEHVKYWKAQGFKDVDRRWYLFYRNCSGIDDVRYVPENIYYNKIEPNLNNQYLSFGYADKNFYERRYNPDLFPETILRCINGIFYDRFYNKIDENDSHSILDDCGAEECVLKPTIDSGGGRGVQIARIDRGEIFDAQSRKISFNDRVHFYGGNFVIQHKIEQNEFFARFHSDSINTMKLYTYYSEHSDEAYVLKSVLRMGINNRFMDNQGAGGISCGICPDGRLNSFAYDKYGYTCCEHPNSKMSFEDKVVPNFSEAINVAKRIQNSNHHFRVLGIDMYVDRKGNTRILEINTKNNEINFHQLYGGSLFGDFTEEVIEISKKQVNRDRILWY